MEAGYCIKIFDPYEWLPAYGENAVEIFTEGLDLIVLVVYDSENEGLQQRQIKFKSTKAFYKGSFPGVHMLQITYNARDKENISIGCLVEFPESEVARAWTNHFQNIKLFRHYKWVFLSENIMLEIIAEEVSHQLVTGVSMKKEGR